MYSQFQFLEYVVLDVSKQIRDLQNRHLTHEKEKGKLLNKISQLENQIIDLNLKNSHQLQDLEHLVKHGQLNLKETNKTIDAFSIEIAKNKENEVIRGNKLNEIAQSLAATDKEVVKLCSSCAILEENTENNLTRSLQFQKEHAEMNEINKKLFMETNMRIRELEQTIASQKSVCHNYRLNQLKEVEELIKVIATLKNSICTLGEGQKANEKKSQAKLDLLKENIQEFVKSSLKKANQSIVFSLKQ
jgi:uncharacterized coiled-coil protein SlyX